MDSLLSIGRDLFFLSLVADDVLEQVHVLRVYLVILLGLQYFEVRRKHLDLGILHIAKGQF